MGIQQLSVLSAALRLGQEFTTADLVRESGASPDAVRKTFQRYNDYFMVVREKGVAVSGGAARVRVLTDAGREAIECGLAEARDAFMPEPPSPEMTEPSGDSGSLLAIERVLFNLVPRSSPQARGILLEEALSHLNFGLGQAKRTADTANAIRLGTLGRTLSCVKAMHRAAEELATRLAVVRAASVRAITEALLNADAAAQFRDQRPTTGFHTGFEHLAAARREASEEADDVVRRLLDLEREPGWCIALGFSGDVFMKSERNMLELRLGHKTAELGLDVRPTLQAAGSVDHQETDKARGRGIDVTVANPIASERSQAPVMRLIWQQERRMDELPSILFDDPAPSEKNSNNQRTIKATIGCVGVGVHSGRRVSLTLQPAPAGHGIVFRRTDLGQDIAARYDQVVDTHLCTVIGAGDARVGMVEHLMAALVGADIDNLLIEIDGPEVPILDGSAASFLFLLDCAGVTEQHVPRAVIEVRRSVRITNGDAFAELHPYRRTSRTAPPVLEMELTTDFTAPAIGRQRYALRLTPNSFRKELSSARDFALAEDVAQLQSVGLARGGSLANTVVVDHERVLNPGGLRMPHEFARHQLMEAVGELALAGTPLCGRFIAHRSGHALNNQLLRTLFADTAAWQKMSPEEATSRNIDVA